MLMGPTLFNSGKAWLVGLRYAQATQNLPPLLAGSDIVCSLTPIQLLSTITL